MTVTRFAPSPTGYIHVGNLRTALMNYLIARQTGGTFILRLDDTDQERSKQEYIDGLIEDLAWLGIKYDRIEQQSKRMARYAEAAEQLKAAGRFYECFETPVELDLIPLRGAAGLLAVPSGYRTHRMERRDHRRYLD